MLPLRVPHTAWGCGADLPAVTLRSPAPQMVALSNAAGRAAAGQEGLAEQKEREREGRERRAAVVLPLFCVSARDAQKIEGRCKLDGPVLAYCK